MDTIPRAQMRRGLPLERFVTHDEIKELAAKTAHEVNRAYCVGLGDTSQPPWAEAPEWQRSSAIKGVEGVLAGNGPEQSHESWLEEKRATGWKYGPVKDPEKKEHPCFVPYSDLPEAQKFKDALFVNSAKGVLAHYTP
jgi:RyR domain